MGGALWERRSPSSSWRTSSARFGTKSGGGRRSCPGLRSSGLFWSLTSVRLATTVEHSSLLSQFPEMVNQIEHDLYSAHGMTVTVAATIDLMGSPNFDRKDLAGLRSLLWHAESMARIGNLVSTWEREVAVGDFTSGVFMEAVWRGLLTPEQLRSDNQEELTATIIQSGIEADFLRKWEHHRTRVRTLGANLKSVEIEAYVGRLDQLLESELFSHGRK